MGGKYNESFAVEVGVMQGCVMSPWLFNIYAWVHEGNEM